jgi:very-short-patch-repair endonuclease
MIILSAAQQRIVSVAELRREFTTYGSDHPRTRAMADALADLEAGATSSNEADFLRECRRRGLPRPTMQTRRRTRTGLRVTDAEFVLASGRRIIVEIDGVGHLSAETWHDDIARHNELAVSAGAVILRVTGWEVRNDPDPFFDQLTAFVDAAA